MNERDYQKIAEDAIMTEYDKGWRRVLNVMATGTGKTWVFAKLFKRMLSRLPGQMLVIAHTEELVNQNKETLELANPDCTVSKEMAEEYADPKADIIVASKDTLGRKDTKRIERFDWNNIDKIVVDEAHHSVGDAYGRILSVAGVLEPNTRKLLLGTTATPNRSDGLGLSQIYDKVAHVYSVRDAVRDGWLVDPKGWVVHTQTSLAGVSKTNGDFTKSELSEVVDTQTRNKQIVDAWLEVGKNRATVVFCVDIKHAQDLAKEFLDAGVSAEAVWGEDPMRASKIQSHKDGAIKVLCNCAVLTEGYDDWRISCVVLARPTLSAVLFAQMIGRGLRISPITGNIKSWLKTHAPTPDTKVDCVIIDVLDASSKNSLLTLPTLMGLHASLDLKGKGLLESIEALETAKEEFPSLDVSKITDISTLKTTLEQVNLFDIRFPEEVEANSELTWFKAVDGGYKMHIPNDDGKRGFARILENALGQWEIVADINSEPLHGVRRSMEEAFKAADEQIRKRVNVKTLACIKREATWHNKPVTSGQKQMLARIFPKRTFLWEQLTAGQASRIIGERLIKWEKK